MVDYASDYLLIECFFESCKVEFCTTTNDVIVNFILYTVQHGPPVKYWIVHTLGNMLLLYEILKIVYQQLWPDLHS